MNELNTNTGAYLLSLNKKAVDALGMSPDYR